MQKILALLLTLILALQVFAQTTKQITENYLVTGPWTDYVVPMKYSYTVSDEGERIMNGPISISGKQNEIYGNVTISGNYLLNASAKNGKLNGPMSITANYHGVKKLRNGQQTENYSYSLSGAFMNGLPNGTFTAKATNFGTSTVTFKKGMLVGAYNVNETIDDRIVNIKGSLNNDGKMVGTWHISILGDASVWEFIDGIRISVSSKSQDSTPKQVEMAKKYASGSISHEELEAEGYFPVQDSICLGDYASDLYFLKFMADWGELPGRDFRTGFWVKYTYLYNILPLPESEFEKILTNYKENGVAPLPVGIDKTTKCYTTHYYVNYGTPSAKLVNRRFTDEQVAQVKDALDLYCRKKPISLTGLFNDSSLRSKAANLQYKYEEFKKQPVTQRYKSLIEDLDELTEALKGQVDGKEITSDGLFYIVPSDVWQQPLSVCYFPVSSLDELRAIEKDATDLYCRKNPITIVGLFKELNVDAGTKDKALNMVFRFAEIKKVEDTEKAYQKYESLIQEVDEVSRTLKDQLDGKDMTSDGQFYIIPSMSKDQKLSSYFAVSSLNDFNAKEKEIRDYGIALCRLLEEEVSNNLELALNGIEKQSKSKLTKLLGGMIVNKGTESFAEVSHDNSVSIEELVEVIAPVLEYKVVSIQRENTINGDSYQAILEFKKKRKKEEIVIPVSMSVTEKGAKIIDKTIAIVSQ